MSKIGTPSLYGMCGLGGNNGAGGNGGGDGGSLHCVRARMSPSII